MITPFELRSIVDKILFVYASVQLQKAYIQQNPNRIGDVTTATNQASTILFKANER